MISRGPGTALLFFPPQCDDSRVKNFSKTLAYFYILLAPFRNFSPCSRCARNGRKCSEIFALRKLRSRRQKTFKTLLVEAGFVVAQVGQLLGLVFLQQGFEYLVQVALHDFIELVES